MPSQFAFVSYQDGGKQTSVDRLHIRSHCMKGKNKREGSRRSLREAKRRAKETAAAHAVQPRHQNKPIISQQESTRDFQTAFWARPLKEERLKALSRMSLSPPVDPTIARFARAVNKTPYELLRMIFTFRDLTDGPEMYTSERFVAFEVDEKYRTGWFGYDDAVLHTVMLTTSALHDYAVKQPPAANTQFHLVKTLSHLNQKLSSEDAHLLDSTLYTILCLAVMSAMFGDYPAVGAHLAGVKKIITLRGGHGYLQLHSKLQHKLESIDLLACLAFGSEPYIFLPPVSWESLFGPSASPADNLTSSKYFNELFDPRLVATFRDLQQLAAAVNKNYSRHEMLSPLTFQPVFSSIQARLLYLRKLLDDPLSQCLCLGTLACLTITYRLPGRKLSYPYLASEMRKYCESINDAGDELRDLVFWLVIVCGIAVFEPDERWMRETWAQVAEPEMSWGDARERLQKVVWIGCIQDELGKQTFRALATQKV